MANQIKCSNCGTEMEITESLSAQIREEIEGKYSAEVKKKEDELKKIKEEILKTKDNFEKEYETKIKEEKVKLWKVAQEKAAEQEKAKFEVELKDLQEQNTEKEKALKIAQEKELEFRKKERELIQKEQGLELELQKKLNENTKKLEEEIKKNVMEQEKMKMLEKDKQLDMMRQQIEDLRRKSEQGSMQIQGEVQEEDLKNILLKNFIFDLVQDVPTGVNGADLVHIVKSNSGNEAGVIVWESKNTKAFSSDWLKKLKDDQGKVKADISILVTRTLPDGIDSFGLVDGVWICSYQFIIPLTFVIRQNLLAMNQVKNSLDGRDEKMHLLYDYLSGSQFRTRIENIVSAFSSMKEDLESEKRSMQRIWARREKEIERVVLNTSGLYGDMQGIAGSAIATVKSLELNFED
jgi:hypothetical protein